MTSPEALLTSATTGTPRGLEPAHRNRIHPAFEAAEHIGTLARGPDRRGHRALPRLRARSRRVRVGDIGCDDRASARVRCIRMPGSHRVQGSHGPYGVPTVLAAKLPEPRPRDLHRGIVDDRQDDAREPGRKADGRMATVGRLTGRRASACSIRRGSNLCPKAWGEIGVRGPGTMRGDDRQPGQTSDCFTASGHSRTGIIGIGDADGCVHLVGRGGGVIIRCGSNVNPGEIEDRLLAHPAVQQCWGFRSSSWGRQHVPR